MKRERNLTLSELINYMRKFDDECINRSSATEIYLNNDYNIVLVQKLLQHSSTAITQKYIGIGTRELEEALEKHIKIPD